MQTAILTLQKLPAPPAGKAYQLWAMIDGQKIYCMEFKPDAQGRVFIQIPIRNWANAPSVSITLEDTGTIPNATGEMVLSSPLI
ncbi:MAG: anti-sigma factor [Synechococcales cyanobacterium CRU_2_2]|nr:anti-sigma factor [Synechococcales cyanobacterium CRU_2_2]